MAIFILVLLVPLLLIWLGMQQVNASYLLTAFAVNFVGLILERWLFFTQANYPQNHYYQIIQIKHDFLGKAKIGHFPLWAIRYNLSSYL